MAEFDELEEIVGPKSVRRGNAVASAAIAGVAPAAGAQPANREEAAALLRLARERGWGVLPWGGGLLAQTGFPPSRYDLAISTRGMNRVVDYQPDDQTVTVEPGLTLLELENVLATRGQFLPLNPPLPQHATVGGLVATGAVGPWAAAFGTPRDWLIGCRVLDGAGEETRGGGLVVKNVAGYDLPKLYTGSWGTLGLLTELTFKVNPKPASCGYARVDLAKASAAEALMGAVLDSDLEPSVLELVHQGAWRALGAPDPGRPWSVFLEFQHIPEGIQWQLQHLAALAGQHDGWFTDLSPERGAPLLEGLRDLPAQPFVARLGLVSSEAAALSERVSALGEGLSVHAHGTLAQVFACGEEADLELVTRLRALADEVGASCVFLRLPAELVGAVDPWGAPPTGFKLMSGIKKTLDPNGMFNPGRFVGRL